MSMVTCQEQRMSVVGDGDRGQEDGLGRREISSCYSEWCAI